MSARPEDMMDQFINQGRIFQPRKAVVSALIQRTHTKYTVNKVYVMHGLLLSSIKLALTVGNAVNQDAFELNSFSDLIFGGSVEVEAVGFVFAIAMALRALLYPVEQGLIGVGVPALAIVEAWVVAGSHEEIIYVCGHGIGAQSLGFLVFALVSWITSPASLPTASTVLWICMAVVCTVLLCACYRRHPAGHDMFNVCLSVFIAVPFVVEISESALLFTSDSIPFVAYLLAVLDLAVIAPVAASVFLGIAIFLFEMVTMVTPSAENTSSAV